MKVESPDPDWFPTRLNVSKGLVAIVFSKVDEKHRIHRRYLVLSATSGDVVGWYQPNDETGDHDVCFKDGKQFVFMGSNDANQLYFVTANIR
jgi:hypothetical protein